LDVGQFKSVVAIWRQRSPFPVRGAIIFVAQPFIYLCFHSFVPSRGTEYGNPSPPCWLLGFLGGRRSLFTGVKILSAGDYAKKFAFRLPALCA